MSGKVPCEPHKGNPSLTEGRGNQSKLHTHVCDPMVWPTIRIYEQHSVWSELCRSKELQVPLHAVQGVKDQKHYPCTKREHHRTMTQIMLSGVSSMRATEGITASEILIST